MRYIEESEAIGKERVVSFDTSSVPPFLLLSSFPLLELV
jgi:hypothetical protein